MILQAMQPNLYLSKNIEFPYFEFENSSNSIIIIIIIIYFERDTCIASLPPCSYEWYSVILMLNMFSDGVHHKAWPVHLGGWWPFNLLLSIHTSNVIAYKYTVRLHCFLSMWRLNNKKKCQCAINNNGLWFVYSHTLCSWLPHVITVLEEKLLV